MKIFKTGSFLVELLGYAAGGLALWHFYFQQTQMFSSSPPVYDKKYGAAIEALGLIGGITLVLAGYLRKIEKRLDKLEQDHKK